MSLNRPHDGWSALIAELAGAFDRKIAPDRVTHLSQFLDLVVEWNKKLDLTAARDARALVDLMLADALLLADHASEPQRWVDVGTGAGAPGLVLAVFAPHLHVTLVEPLGKRVAFLRTVVGTLKLAHVQVQRARSSDVVSQSFAVATSRATLAPEEWLAEGARIATDRVWVFLAEDAPPEHAGWVRVADKPYAWPLSGVPRRAVCYRPSSVVTDPAWRGNV